VRYDVQMKRTHDELLNELRKQVGFLERSCTIFDTGNEDEAVRIAVVLRVLVHDTDKSVSLLKQLGIKDQLKFIDSASPIDPQPTGEKRNGGTVMIMSGLPGLIGISPTRMGGKFVAPLSPRPYTKGAVAFDEWWNDKNIPGHNKARYSRKWLVTKMANNEGGAHVDPDITKGYQELSTSSLGMTIVANGVEGFINSAADVSVRQIAWEVLQTLEQSALI
jgi:hypothetical protein